MNETITITMSANHARPYAEKRLAEAIAEIKAMLEAYTPEVIEACNAFAKARAEAAGMDEPPIDYKDLVRRHWAYVIYIELEAKLESRRFAGDRATVAFVRQLMDWAEEITALRQSITADDTSARNRLPQLNQYGPYLAD